MSGISIDSIELVLWLLSIDWDDSAPPGDIGDIGDMGDIGSRLEGIGSVGHSDEVLLLMFIVLLLLLLLILWVGL